MTVEVHTRHHSKAREDRLRVPTVLAPSQLNGMRRILIQHRIIKPHRALDRRDSVGTHMVPDQPGQSRYVVAGVGTPNSRRDR